ncbi:MAG: hypothetical protein P8Q39_02810 [Candidatus Thalassarchaeaceae archaeon]|nr:hypothetical protein [Candidatus Thalassarchaeaceae archaeon]
MSEDEPLLIARAPTDSADLLGAFAGLDNIEIEFTEVSTNSLNEGFEKLQNGETDLLLAAANDVSELGELEQGLMIVGALPLRDWNYVLVSEDRPNHLPKNAIVLSQNQLARRQLRRFRPDARVRSPKAHLGITETEKPESLDYDDIYSFVNWAEELRQSEEIDGYAIPRHIHRLAGFKTRRHALTQDVAENELFRFLPPPHAGTIIIVGRTGFPRNKISAMLDHEAETSWQVNEILLKNMNSDIKNKVGILVRHRQPGTLIREAERKRDLLTRNVLVNPEGELTTDEVKVDIQIELVSHRGNSTISMQRIADLQDTTVVTNFLSDEWSNLVKLGTRDGKFLDL